MFSTAFVSLRDTWTPKRASVRRGAAGAPTNPAAAWFPAHRWGGGSRRAARGRAAGARERPARRGGRADQPRDRLVAGAPLEGEQQLRRVWLRRREGLRPGVLGVGGARARPAGRHGEATLTALDAAGLCGRFACG